MTYEEIKEFIGKQVVVRDVGGKSFKGIITNTESEYDTSSGKEEIELDAGKVFYGIPLDEIKDIIEIKISCQIILVAYIFEEATWER